MQDEPTPYEFYINKIELETEVRGTLEETLDRLGHHEVEKVLQIVYQPLELFRVRAVTRCSSSLPGHTEAVIAVSFSPDGR
jgi:ribosome assembly protein 4